MIELLILILIGALIVLVLFWVIDAIGLPHPINLVAKVLVALIFLLFLLQRSGLLSGAI